MMTSHVVTLTMILLLCNFDYLSAQDCVQARSNGGDSLPAFNDPGNSAPRIAINPIQAIIKSYEFHCCGRVGGWGAYVEPGGRFHDGVYTIKFQIWRPVGGDSYVKIGENTFSLVDLDPSSVINVTPQSNQQLHFQPRDVMGYYLEQTGDSNGGLQFDNAYTQEELWYLTGNSAIQNECRLDVGTGGDLISSTSLGPIISVSPAAIGSVCPSTFTSVLCPTPSSHLISSTSLGPIISVSPAAIGSVGPSTFTSVLCPTPSSHLISSTSLGPIISVSPAAIGSVGPSTFTSVLCPTPSSFFTNPSSFITNPSSAKLDLLRQTHSKSMSVTPTDDRGIPPTSTTVLSTSLFAGVVVAQALVTLTVVFILALVAVIALVKRGKRKSKRTQANTKLTTFRAINEGNHFYSNVSNTVARTQPLSAINAAYEEASMQHDESLYDYVAESELPSSPPVPHNLVQSYREATNRSSAEDAPEEVMIVNESYGVSRDSQALTTPTENKTCIDSEPKNMLQE